MLYGLCHIRYLPFVWDNPVEFLRLVHDLHGEAFTPPYPPPLANSLHTHCP